VRGVHCPDGEMGGEGVHPVARLCRVTPARLVRAQPVVPMSPAPPSAKPRFIGPLAKPNFGLESVVNRPPAITADIMLQPKRVAGCPIDFTKDV
jgi:hypothetical protein